MGDLLVLIVEDNENNAKLLRDVLTVRGFRTHDTTTAEDGLAYARRELPDLILMDIQLPGMDGITALKHLRSDAATRAIPVIAVTASAMPMDRNRILSAGFDGYITKPISVKDFVREIEEILEARRT